jgi:hypothetical protein
MTDSYPPMPPENDPASPYAATPSSNPAGGLSPYNKLAIWGFVIACVSAFIFGILGVVGVVLSQRAIKQIALSGERGRGLAIAGTIIGIIAVVYYFVTRFL